MTHIFGRDLQINSRVKTWFMPGGTFVLSIDMYRGPLEHLWPDGARIVSFASCTRSGSTGMTVGNDELLELA